MLPLYKTNKIKALLLIILIIGLPFFLAFYELIFLSYYPETIADQWAGYVVLPLLIVSISFMAIEKYKAYRKSESKKIWPSLKTTLLQGFIVLIFFWYILRPIISGAIIFINANIGQQTEEIVEGVIIARKDYNGSRSFEYKLTIKTDFEVLIFDTDTKVIVTHHKGDVFKEKMIRGSLGLLYNR